MLEFQKSRNTTPEEPYLWQRRNFPHLKGAFYNLPKTAIMVGKGR